MIYSIDYFIQCPERRFIGCYLSNSVAGVAVLHFSHQSGLVSFSTSRKRNALQLFSTRKCCISDINGLSRAFLWEVMWQCMCCYIVVRKMRWAK